MKYHQVTQTALSDEALKEAYANAHVIGSLRIGDAALFFRAGMKTYYIPYSDVTRCFRRVQLVPARMCCGRGDLAVENLVICSGETELAQIALPGEKAGKAALEELKKRIPQAVFTAPITKP